MCEKSNKTGWSKVLNDAEPSDGETLRASFDTITPTAISGTQATAENSADDPKRVQSHSEQTRAGVSRTIYTARGKLSSERVTGDAGEQVLELTDRTEEKLTEDKPEEAIPETNRAAEDAVYQATTGRVENIMQNEDKTVTQVIEPAFGQATEMASLTAQPMPTATPSKEADLLGVNTQTMDQIAEPTIGMAHATASLAAQPLSTAARSREMGSSVIDAVVQNPLPAALMGLGLSWLLMNVYQNRKRSASYNPGQVDHLTHEPMSSMQNPSPQGQSAAARVQSAIGDISESAQETASSVVSRIQHQVSNAADRTREQVSHLASRVQHGVRQTGYRYQQSLQENPLALGAAALALGSTIGSMLPSTSAEDKLMGKAHEDLIRKIDEATHGTIQKVREVAGDVGRAARSEAELQGLTG